MTTRAHPETARIYDLSAVRAERERAAKPAPQSPVIERGAWYHAAAIRESEPPRKR